MLGVGEEIDDGSADPALQRCKILQAFKTICDVAPSRNAVNPVSRGQRARRYIDRSMQVLYRCTLRVLRGISAGPWSRLDGLKTHMLKNNATEPETVSNLL